jgi:hypothetical protein
MISNQPAMSLSLEIESRIFAQYLRPFDRSVA